MSLDRADDGKSDAVASAAVKCGRCGHPRGIHYDRHGCFYRAGHCNCSSFIEPAALSDQHGATSAGSANKKAGLMRKTL